MLHATQLTKIYPPFKMRKAHNNKESWLHSHKTMTMMTTTTMGWGFFSLVKAWMQASMTVSTNEIYKKSNIKEQPLSCWKCFGWLPYIHHFPEDFHTNWHIMCVYACIYLHIFHSNLIKKEHTQTTFLFPSFLLVFASMHLFRQAVHSRKSPHKWNDPAKQAAYFLSSV